MRHVRRRRGQSIRIRESEASDEYCVTWMEMKDGQLLSRAENPTRYPRIRCMHFGKSRFSLAIANTLMFCPACPLKPVPTVHYTDAGGDTSNLKGMLQHWHTKHPGLEFPAELKHTITPLERESDCKVGKDPPKKRASASFAAAGSTVASSAAASSAVANAVAATGAAVDESRDDEGAIAEMIEGT
jgi:hypothetical protein